MATKLLELPGLALAVCWHAFALVLRLIGALICAILNRIV